MQQEGIGQRGQSQQLEPTLPVPEARTLHAPFTFARLPHPFDVPASGVGQHDLPGLRFALHRLAGKPIPGRAPLAAGHDSPQQQIGMVGMTHGEGQPTFTDPLASTRIPEPATAPGLFALRDLPGGFELAVTEQARRVLKAEDEAGGVGVQGPHPQTTGVAAIKDMPHLAPPTAARPLEQFLVLIAAPTAPPAACCPPAQGRKPHRSLRQAQAHEQQADPMQPRHPDRLAGWGVVARLDVGQAFGEAFLHWPQSLTLEAFRLLPHEARPNQQSLFSLTLPLLHLLTSSPPQKAVDDGRRPLRAVQQAAQALGTPSLAKGIEVTTQLR
jgi:hypothetical protein